jgi:cytidylate kinase
MTSEKAAAAARSEGQTKAGSRGMTVKRLKLAIDGPAGAGKSTVAKLVADALGYLYIDTGAMYRAITCLAMKGKIPLTDEAAIAQIAATAKIDLQPADAVGGNVHVFINDEEVTKEIRSQQVTKLVSTVAALALVRSHLVEKQRELAKPGGVVLDGRDIGTVVLPDADLKIFLTASAEVRAKRRLRELAQAGEKPDYQALLKDIVERDHMDSNRAVAPLHMADDAVLILTDNMSVSDVVSHIVQLCALDG